MLKRRELKIIFDLHIVLQTFARNTNTFTVQYDYHYERYETMLLNQFLFG